MSSIKRAVSPHVPEPAPGTWSNCLVVGKVAYLAGITARGADLTDEYSQAKAVFAKIKHLVEAAGGSMADIVKVSILAGPPRIFHRRLSGVDAGASGRARRSVAQGRDRGRGASWSQQRIGWRPK